MDVLQWPDNVRGKRDFQRLEPFETKAFAEPEDGCIGYFETVGDLIDA